MKLSITRAELLQVQIPLLHSFTISGGTVRDKKCLLVKLTDSNGVVGYGEAPLFEEPIYLTETLTGAHKVLEAFMLPLILKETIEYDEKSALDGIDAAMKKVDSFRGFEFAKAAIAQALCHLVAENMQVSLQTLFGGTAKTIPVGESLGINSLEAVVEEANLRVSEGYKRIKLKIKPGHDLEVVKAVRKAHPTIPLMVDANSAYTLDDIDLLKALDPFDLLMMEQPLSYDDIIDHATLQKAIRTPVCLDESILCLRHVRQAVETGACNIINIKPSRVAGPVRAKQIHDWCLARKVPVWCGGMLESGIGRAFNIALASLPGFTLPADMSPSAMYFPYDLVKDPYVVQDGLITVPTTPGLGYVIDEEMIRKSTTSRTVLPHD